MRAIVPRMNGYMKRLNIAHSEWPEQQGGLMICGYEWGGDGAANAGSSFNDTISCTFVNKELRYGPEALDWPYDKRIRKWFSLWGRPLDHENPGPFERSLIQTNWCDTQNPRMNGAYTLLWQPEQAANFMGHVAYFRPRMVLFMGSKLIDALQAPETLEKFEGVVGKCVSPYRTVQRPFDGIRFKVGYQSFERCEVVCFPHPSASRGLSDSYIDLFSTEIRSRLNSYAARFSAPLSAGT